MPHPPLVALTGAETFLGREVASRLLADGWAVRLLLRAFPERLPAGAEVVVGAASDPRALRRLVAGAQAVAHCAGIGRARRAADYYEANVEVADRLGRAIRAEAAGTRLVVASSLAARFPWLTAHAASRADGEDAAIDAARTRDWVVLRLAPIFGPGDRKTLTLMRAATWPLMPIPDRPRARLSLLAVTDAAAAVAAACGPGPRGMVWEIGQGGRSWAEIARAVAGAVACTPRLVPLPPRLLALGAALTHPLGSATPPMLDRDRLGELVHDDWVARPDHQPPAGLWRCRIGLDAGLHAAAEWFRRNGWLPQPITLAVSQPR